MRPRLYVSAQRGSTRSIEDLRGYCRTEFGGRVWGELLARVDADVGSRPFTLATPLPERSEEMTSIGAHDWYIANRTVQRIVYASLAHLLTEDPRYLKDALSQLRSLMDDGEWPDWRHEVNAAKGIVADHRVGGYVFNISIAYDWLCPFLNDSDRKWIRDGLIRKGIDRIHASRETDAHWGRYNNWTALIVAGAGLAGMSLGDEYPLSNELIDFSKDWMDTYLSSIGPNGEFNESPAYAASMMTPIRYYGALRSVDESNRTILESTRLRQFGHWYAWHFLPPDRIVGFGDADRGSPPSPIQVGAIAALFSDSVLQWFYEQYRHIRRYDNHPSELLGIDPTIVSVSPASHWPKARLYHGYGAHAISRSSWDAGDCVVYGKSAHGWEDARVAGDKSWYHLDFDAGQLCIDGCGAPLIVDLYNSGGYGLPDLDRRDYYGKGTFGHNVLMIDRQNTVELGVPPPRLIASEIDPELGAWWRTDLSGTYEDVKRVTRTVIHLLPGIVVAHDSAELIGEGREVSLRWHTVDSCIPDENGNFVVRSDSAQCVARMVNLSNKPATFTRGEHHYEPPYDVNYHHIPYPQHESYIEATVVGSRVDLLTLFYVGSSGSREIDEQIEWRGDGEWHIETPEGEARVSTDRMSIEVNMGLRGWSVPLQSERL